MHWWRLVTLILTGIATMYIIEFLSDPLKTLAFIITVPMIATLCSLNDIATALEKIAENMK